jgi:hypothetical protein
MEDRMRDHIMRYFPQVCRELCALLQDYSAVFPKKRKVHYFLRLIVHVLPSHRAALHTTIRQSKILGQRRKVRGRTRGPPLAGPGC